MQLECALSESAHPRGRVLLIHGISADMDEEGAFVRLAEDLAGEGFISLRFSFRAHGNSQGTGEGLTVAGEQLDLLAAYGALVSKNSGPTGIVAASFGAVALLLSWRLLNPAPDSLVLWNPVLDVHG